jgi:hypothetical protein
VAQLRQDNWRKRAKPAKSRAMRFVGKVSKESGLKKRCARQSQWIRMDVIPEQCESSLLLKFAVVRLSIAAFVYAVLHTKCVLVLRR